MNKRISLLALPLALGAALTVPAGAQTTRPTPVQAPAQTPALAPQAQPAALAALPASDAVLSVDVRRLLQEVLPRVYANNPTKLTQINADIETFRTRTGLDPRTFERVAVGVQFAQLAGGHLKLEPVVLARGTFNAAALVAAGRIAAAGQYQEQQYKGKTVYLFNLGRQVKFLNVRLTDVAVVALDNGLLAFGSPARVRATIDANGGGSRVAPEVLALAQHDPNAIIGVGGNIPPGLTQGLDFLNPEISRSIAAIRQFYGSFGPTTGGFQMLTVLRAENAAAARTLTDTVEGLKQLAPFAISRLTGERARLAQQLVDSTRVAAQGNDVQISLQVTDANAAALGLMF